MHSDKETDLITWILAALVVMISVAAVALYPHDSAASAAAHSRQSPPATAGKPALLQKTTAAISRYNPG